MFVSRWPSISKHGNASILNKEMPRFRKNECAYFVQYSGRIESFEDLAENAFSRCHNRIRNHKLSRIHVSRSLIDG